MTLRCLLVYDVKGDTAIPLSVGGEGDVRMPESIDLTEGLCWSGSLSSVLLLIWW